MTPRVTFVLGIHDHQPVGNFDHVFEEAYERAYAPFLAALERHPALKCSIHTSGPLVEWLEERHPAYLDALGRLVERGQVEVVGGAFYEPILPAISEDDAAAQIDRMSAWCRERFGKRPRGAWVAERVWAGTLPRPLARAGIEYVSLDTHHFECAGVAEADLDGRYVTECEGRAVSVFPISKALRYAIPFEEPAKTIEILRRAGERSAKEGREAVVVMADDGEKFGSWPGTHKHCYEDGWLERFLRALAAESSWLRTATFAEALDSVPARGRIYLPETSYKEMTEWAPGGLWKNFLVKYPESNRMQKKALRVSAKVRRLKGPDRDEAERSLHRGECNCAYWHGVFGGLYLNFLRGAVWANLIEAERIADLAGADAPFARIAPADLDLDGRDEVLVETDSLVAAVAPARGGAIEEISVRALGANLLDTLARRPEAYHEKIRQAAHGGIHEGRGTGKAASIHDEVRVKEAHLDRLLEYDAVERLAAQDRLLEPAVDLRAVPWEVLEVRGASGGGAGPSGAKRGRRKDEAVAVRLGRSVRVDGTVPTVGGPADVRIEKTITFLPGRASIEAAYRISNAGPAPATVVFATEWSLGLQAPEASDRWIEVNGRRPLDSRPVARALDEGVRTVAAIDGWRRFRATLAFDPPALDVRREPIETVSASEAGFERAYQGTTLAPRWRLDLPAGAARDLVVRFDVALTR